MNLDELQHYKAPEQLLAGKNILVTGASAGIGEAAALAYAKHGATVILIGRNGERLEATYDAIESAGGPQPVICPLDLEIAGESEYQSLAEQINDSLGALHGLLHNAGLLGKIQPLEQTQLDEWHKVMQVNLHSNFLLTKALLPALRKADSASVVFSSSGVGRRGRAYWGAYAISKFATEGMMQIWADELANTDNIRINSLNPGATNTAMRRSAYPAEQPDTNPLPEDIMGAYLFLMGDGSASVNGQALNAQVPQP